MKPLEGISVLDLSQGPAGGLATMMLSDFGATVIKVEKPGGDPFRCLAAAPMWLRGKQSIELNLKSPAGVARLHGLVADSDLLVSNQQQHQAAKLACDYATLAALNPRLIYCQITGFGDRGPYAALPAYEGVVAAKAGRMKGMEYISARDGPAYSAVPVMTHATAQNTLSALLAALLERRRSGLGQLVKTSLLQGLMPYEQGGALSVQLWEKRRAAADKPAPRPASTAPRQDPRAAMPSLNYHPVQAGDGRWIQLGNLLPHLFMNYIRVAGLEPYLEKGKDGQLLVPDRGEALERFRDLMLARMQEKSAAEWMDLFVADGGVVAHPYMTAEAALDDDDIRRNGHAVEANGMVQLGPVARLTATPGSISGPAPGVGQHTLSARFPNKSDASGKVADSSPNAAPLTGVTIVEFATIIAAPLAASFLADLGARVIKVEPVGGDPFRTMGGGIGAARCNNGKESISVDLKTPAGQEVARKLIAKADVMIHNYRPGVPERLGISYAEAQRVNPEIVYISANGYGPDGPGALRPSTHPIPGAALGGAAYQAGGMPETELLGIDRLRETAKRLSRANEVNPDPNTSMVVCSAALLGLYARQTTGKGQKIYVDMFGANAYANFDDFVRYDGKPRRLDLGPELLGPHPLYRLYPCQEGWVFLALVLPREWRSFCQLTNRTDLLENPDFRTPEQRQRNDKKLEVQLSALFQTAPAAHWEAMLAGQGIGCVQADGPAVHEFFLRDLQVLENGWMVKRVHARWGEYLRHGPMVEFSRSDTGPLSGAGLGGDHSDALLRELGYSAEAIMRLRERGLIWSESLS